MSQLPDTASFHERVQALFVVFRGSGVSLSGGDLDLLDAWAALEVPFEVVARGIRRAAEHALWDAAEGEGGLRSLRAARRSVDAEIARYLKRAAGKTDARATNEVPFHVTRHHKLMRAVRRRLGKGTPAWLSRLPEPAGLPEADRQEAMVLLRLLRTLPTRRELLAQARAQLPQTLSAASRREALRFHRLALVHRALELPSLW